MIRDRTTDKIYISKCKTHTQRRKACQKLTVRADQSNVHNKATF